MGLKKITFICLFLYCLLTAGCGGMPGFKSSPKPSKSDSQGSSIYEEPLRLIKNYGAMIEDDTVSWSWINPGFSLANVSNVRIDKVENLSGVVSPLAEESIANGLNSIFSPSARENKGLLETGLKSAIVEMKPRKGFAGRYVPFVDDTTYIEVEIIIYNINTEAPLCKIVHYSKEENFQRCIDLLFEDLAVFAKKSLGG